MKTMYTQSDQTVILDVLEMKIFATQPCWTAL